MSFIRQWVVGPAEYFNGYAKARVLSFMQLTADEWINLMLKHGIYIVKTWTLSQMNFIRHE